MRDSSIEDWNAIKEHSSMGGSTRRPAKGVHVCLLPVKILIVLIFATVALSLVVSVKIHSLEFPLDFGLDRPLATAVSPLVGEELASSFSAGESDKTTSRLSEILQDPERQPLLKILRQAGYDFNDIKVFTPEVLDSLPKWSDVVELYGGPVILGLESCKRFRDTVPSDARTLGIAGMFNSGTNILNQLMVLNCARKVGIASDSGIEWQVPWGKHMPLSQRSQHPVRGFEGKNFSEYFPVVAVRDPYTWMQSMCRQAYIVQFDHSTDPERNLCPNIVPYKEDIKAHPRYAKFKYIPAHAKYVKGLHIQYPSIAHLWNEWYSAYVNETSFPRLIVRMEDIIFRAEEVLPKICECYGGTWRHANENELQHHADVANQNVGIDVSVGSGLLRSIINYGSRTLRRKHYQAIQFEAAREVLDPKLMNLFRYSYEPP